MEICLWWGKIVLVAFLSLFFFVFGVETLIHTFNMKNPLEFIMYFFSASLMTLVSLVGLVYVVTRVHAFFKNSAGRPDVEP